MSASQNQKISLLAVFLCLFLLCPSVPSFAADGDVQLAGHAVFTGVSGSDGLTVSQRANDIQTKLNNALVASQDKSAGAVSVVYYNGSPIITLGGFQVATVTRQDADAAGTTPALLAQQWANSLKQSLGNAQQISGYIAQLTGGAPDFPSVPAPAPAPQPTYSPPGAYQNPNYPPPSDYQQPPTAGAGMTIPITLETSISTQISRPGDLVVAKIAQPVALANGIIPAGTTVKGNITASSSGKMLNRSGLLTITFNTIQLPNGAEIPIQAHLVGDIGKYVQKGQDTVRGEGGKAKAFGIGMRTLGGAGVGAVFGTALGAIAGGRPGTGAWAGTAIGGGAGLLEGAVLRKGRNVLIPGGTPMQLQLDAPIQLVANQYNS